MPRLRGVLAVAAIAAVSLAPAVATAQVYAAEDTPGFIVSYDGAVGTVVNPDTLIPGVRGISLDEFGRIVVAACCDQADVMRLDPDTQTLEYLDDHVFGWGAEDVYTDPADASIYVIKNGNVHEVGERCDSFLGVLPGGMGPVETLYVFGEDETLIDLQVWPIGERAGNILVLLKNGVPDGGCLAEFEKTGPETVVRLPNVVDWSSMTSAPRGFAITPDGGIVIVDQGSGLYNVIEGSGGTLVPFGEATGPGLSDIEIGSDGTIYLVNSRDDRIERYDEYGVHIAPDLTDGITSPTAVTAASFTATPEGENSYTEPLDGVQITYQEVTQAGYTTAAAETTQNRVSPEGNYLPDYAALPGSRADYFTYISIATEAIYRGLIQVDILMEGSRLFYASGVGDTFRCFTYTGTIEDARGTMPRFSEQTLGSPGRDDTGPTEVVLVEDTRDLSEVTLYKFWRLELAMDVSDYMPGGDPCPWYTIEWLQKYPERARNYYDLGQVTNALSELAIMNALIRDYSGWCIPDLSDDELGNIVGKILAHSKTLIFSLEQEAGEAFTGMDEARSEMSLAVTSPAAGRCMLELAGPVGAEASLRIYTVSGRLVTTLFEGTLGLTPEVMVWDGADGSGSRVASGVYFARAETEDQEETRKLVFLK